MREIEIWYIDIVYFYSFLFGLRLELFTDHSWPNYKVSQSSNYIMHLTGLIRSKKHCLAKIALHL